MAGVPQEIVERQLGHLHKVHPSYASGMRAALAKAARAPAEAA
jgi:catalase